ncbi:MAG: hypothetical protein ACJ790_15170, partial [Myxococcaceae bacterium]
AIVVMLMAGAAFGAGTLTEKSPLKTPATRAGSSATDTTGALFWFDGNVQRPLFADPVLVAEVHPSDETKALILAADPSAQIVSSRGVRLWKVTSTAQMLSKVAGLLPVLRDQASGAGKARVAAGDVVVQLDPAVDAAAFLKENGLEKKREVGTLAIVIAAPAGYDAIRLANRLHGLPGVKLAMPNWWVAAKAK